MFFQSGKASKRYALTRDSESLADVREYCEAAWSQYEPFNGDPHFLSDAMQNFHARTWEMLLACTLLDAGLELAKPPSDGPDILVRDDGRSIWLEAVTVDLGRGANNAARIESFPEGKSGLFRTQPEKTVLRYTSALIEKNRQLSEFRERGIVAPEDVFVVAINGALLHDYSSGDGDPEILKAVYPIGEAYITHTPYSEEPPRSGWHHRPFVEKASGAKIPTTAFTGNDYVGVSGLLYSRTTAWNPKRADSVLMIHNARADVPLPQGFFPFGRETLLADESISWHEHQALVAKARSQMSGEAARERTD